ncbi:MAG: hypothetical protein AVDCRST_MAG59-552, partial [uncultured Thermomicrobiales bacterium]
GRRSGRGPQRSGHARRGRVPGPDDPQRAPGGGARHPGGADGFNGRGRVAAGPVRNRVPAARRRVPEQCGPLRARADCASHRRPGARLRRHPRHGTAARRRRPDRNTRDDRPGLRGARDRLGVRVGGGGRARRVRRV